MYGCDGCQEWCPFCDPSDETIKNVKHAGWRVRLGWAIVRATLMLDDSDNGSAALESFRRKRLAKLVAEWKGNEAKKAKNERKRLGPYVEPIGPDDPCIRSM